MESPVDPVVTRRFEEISSSKELTGAGFHRSGTETSLLMEPSQLSLLGSKRAFSRLPERPIIGS